MKLGSPRVTASMYLGAMRTVPRAALIPWGVMDQALNAACGLLTSIFLARELGPTAFGSFALAQTVLVIVWSLQAPIFTMPHNVLAATRHGREYTSYTSATLMSQLIFAWTTALLILAGAATAHAVDLPLANLLFVLAIIVVPCQLQEFVRQLRYTKGDDRGAFMNDAITEGSRLLGIGIAWHSGMLTDRTALGIIGVGCVVGSSFGLWQNRQGLMPVPPRTELFATIRENWDFGKWLLVGALVSMLSTPVYPFLAAGVINVAAAGVLRASQTVLGPISIIQRYIDTSLTPRAAVVYKTGGPDVLRAYVRTIYVIAGPAVLGYCIFVATFGDTILVTLFGDGYRGYGWFLAVIGVSFVLQSCRFPLTIALKSTRSTGALLEAQIWSLGVFLTVGVLAVYVFGLAGIAIGLVGQAIVGDVVLWRRYLNATSEE